MYRLCAVLILYAVAATPALAAPIRLTATIQPVQFILAELAGERAETVTLVKPGASPHTYDLRPSDLKAANGSKALFYISDTLDGWAAKLDVDPKIELLPLVPKDFQLAALDDDDHHDHENGAGDEHRHGPIDPHFWLDPLTVKALLPALCDRLIELDPDGSAAYTANAERFSHQLDDLNEELSGELQPFRSARVLLSHNFLQYFLKRYGLESSGALEAIPGKEPTAKRMKEFIDAARRESIRAVLLEPQRPDRAARILAESAGLKIAVIDPLGGVEGRMSYLALMRYNAAQLTEALQ
ncbi:MAG: hypothetical protein GC154_13385 [bacterium]|nr:hypothetical protein [bacterium]